MKVLNFTYTDLKNKVTQRELLVTSEPSDKVSGIDLTPLDEESRAAFVGEYTRIYNNFLTELGDLKAEYDVTHNYRQFFPDKMTEVSQQDYAR